MIPYFEDLILPFLKIIKDGKEHTTIEVRDILAQEFGLTSAELNEYIPSGRKTVFDNRIHWAKAHLKMANLIENIKPGLFKITKVGTKALLTNPTRIDIEFLKKYRIYRDKFFIKKKYHITNVSEYLTVLKKTVSNDNEHEYFYRGHADNTWKLEPSIYREQEHGIKYLNYEDKIFREIILKTPNEFINEITAIEKLVKMQHYQIPTRILDITSNPLIALYFVCCEKPDSDAEVIAFEIPKEQIKFYDSDTVSMLSNLAKMPENFEIERKFLQRNSKNNTKVYNEKSEWAGYLLHEIKNEKPQFTNIMNPFHFNQVIPVKVKQSNERIIKQNGAFLLFGIKEGKKGIPAELNNNDYDNNEIILGNIEILHGDKPAILKDLEKLGIHEGSIFPEIEHQAKVVKKLYSS